MYMDIGFMCSLVLLVVIGLLVLGKFRSNSRKTRDEKTGRSASTKYYGGSWFFHLHWWLRRKPIIWVLSRRWFWITFFTVGVGHATFWLNFPHLMEILYHLWKFWWCNVLIFVGMGLYHEKKEDDEEITAGIISSLVVLLVFMTISLVMLAKDVHQLETGSRTLFSGVTFLQPAASRASEPLGPYQDRIYRYTVLDSQWKRLTLPASGAPAVLEMPRGTGPWTADWRELTVNGARYDISEKQANTGRWTEFVDGSINTKQKWGVAEAVRFRLKKDEAVEGKDDAVEYRFCPAAVTPVPRKVAQ
jgi:hypothetical protein